MTQTTAVRPRAIALINGDGTEMSEFRNALDASTQVSVETRNGTLSQLNGTVVKLAQSHSALIFKVDPASDEELAALGALRKSSGSDALLVALTSPDTSLSQARRLMDAGASDVLPWNSGAEELRRHVETWIKPVRTATRSGSIVAVMPARGGIGASTVAVNLADQLLARRGFRKVPTKQVAIVDLDVQFGTVAALLDIEPRDTLYTLASDGTVPDPVFLHQAMITSKCGLRVLSAPSRFMPLDALSVGQVGALLDTLRTEYDYVVVDLPRCLVGWLTAVIERSDRLLLVTDTSVPSIRQSRRLLDAFFEDNPALDVEMVVNHESRPMIRNRQHVEAAKALQRPLNLWIAHDAKTARIAADRGAPVASVAGRSKLSKGIATVARSTLKSLTAHAPTAPSNR